MSPTVATSSRCAWPHPRAFTLLELIIVLAVMVGLLAVVWPNLQRPLQRTSLDEAAQIVRDAIEESRYQAALQGTLYFVQLQEGSSQLRSGVLAGFLDDSAAAGLEQDSPATGSPPIRVWRLPASVVVSHVDWTLESVLPPSQAELDQHAEVGANARDPQLVGTETDLPMGDTGPNMATSATELNSARGRQWWLPLTAAGQGRDAVIELVDASIHQHLRVTYSAATGAMEISR